jgi:aldehyde dehydrogenase (NAD+)
MPSGRLLINGRWRGAADGATMPTFDPTTEEKITDVAKATPDDANEAVKAASEAFESGTWARMHHEARAKILFRMADLLDERADEFAIREAMDMGMPYRDFRETIVPHCSGLFRFFGGLGVQMNGGYRQSYEPAIRILTRREPLGEVACITPFDFPLVLTCSKVAPALAAGNTVVHKPASDTPLTALALAQVALDAGAPDGVYNLVTGPGGSLGDTLVKHQLVDKVAFTGSTTVGQNIIRNSADTLKHTTMELGGKGTVYDEVVEKLAKLANNAVLGDPLEPQTKVGPIASKAEYDKVLRYVDAGKQSTAKLVAGGGVRKINGKGLFIEPTVFANATNDLKISREEIFGPVLPVIPFEGGRRPFELPTIRHMG